MIERSSKLLQTHVCIITLVVIASVVELYLGGIIWAVD